MTDPAVDYGDTDIDIDFARIPDRRKPIENDVSAIREGVDCSLIVMRGVIDELVAGGTIAHDGQVAEAMNQLTQYCAISLEMIKRTPL